MLVALAEGGPIHGYRIARRVAASAAWCGDAPDATGVYRALKAMEGRGLVVASWDLSDRGPAKRQYRLTADGRACLARWVESLAAYRRSVGRLLAAARRASTRRGAAGRARRRRGAAS